jgi:hypothetical protein
MISSADIAAAVRSPRWRKPVVSALGLEVERIMAAGGRARGVRALAYACRIAREVERTPAGQIVLRAWLSPAPTNDCKE